MTNEQATQIREHLIEELNRNGFNDIVAEVNTRLEEDYGEESFDSSPISLLFFFLEESINVLDSLSNKNYTSLINRFNEFCLSEQGIAGVSVELLNQGEPVLYNLRDLPNYNLLIESFQAILVELRNDN